MKIGLYNLQPLYTNIALEKIRTYYKSHHHIVEDCSPLEAKQYDVVYCSSIFDWTNQRYVQPSFIKGGTGFDLTTTLPLEIDNVLPRINKGFTTRGCIRKCEFCVVPQKEGYIHIVGDLLDLWDAKSTSIILYDNNILAVPEHFALICRQARQHNLKLDFNQGLDHRLLTPELVDLMKSIRHVEYRFAFDHQVSTKTVDKAITLLQSKGINRCSWYTLIGYDSTLEDDLFRLNYLRNRNQIAYVQRFKGKQKPRIQRNKTELIALARWANQHHLYRAMSWQQFLNHPDNKNYKRILNFTS